MVRERERERERKRERKPSSPSLKLNDPSGQIAGFVLASTQRLRVLCSSYCEHFEESRSLHSQFLQEPPEKTVFLVISTLGEGRK
jgi:hypothetical protein